MQPVLDSTGVTFRLDDQHGRLAGVRLLQEISLEAGLLEFSRSRGRWTLRLPLPDVDRMEYLLEIEDHNGNRATITDPSNPRKVGGAFGDKSEVRFPGYREPDWLDHPQVDHTETPFGVSNPHGARLTGFLWHPTTLDDRSRTPLVVVHDGPEYAALGSLTAYLGAAIAAGMLPPLRAVLLAPGNRNSWYSAKPSYARALHAAVTTFAETATVRIGIGVSLGGLAMLHAHRSFPGLFDALMLQSGSFFTQDLDPQERNFSGFRAVTRFVAGVHASASDDHPVPAVLTCGIREENLANNRSMTTTLRRLGYPARLIEVRDAHNYTAWRDSLHPYFTDLVADRAA